MGRKPTEILERNVEAIEMEEAGSIKEGHLLCIEEESLEDPDLNLLRLKIDLKSECHTKGGQWKELLAVMKPMGSTKIT